MKVKIKYFYYLFPIFIICLPRPNFLNEGFSRLMDLGVMIYPLLLLLLHKLRSSNLKIPVSYSNLVLLFLIFAYLSWQIFVLVFNGIEYGFYLEDFVQIYKPLFYVVSIVSGIYFSIILDRNDIYKVLLIIGFINVIVILFQFFEVKSLFYAFSTRSKEIVDIHYLRKDAPARVIGTIGNPNMLGLFISAYIMYFIYIIRQNGEKKILWYILIGLLSLLATQSRTSLILFLLLVIIDVYKSFGIRISAKRLLLFFSILLFLVILTLYTNFFYYLSTGLETILNKGLYSQNSFKVRVENWSDALPYIRNRFIVGNGPAINRIGIEYLDNNYLFVLFRFGIIGLALFISVIFHAIRSLRKTDFNNKHFTLYLWALLILSSFVTESLESMKLTPFILFLSAFQLQDHWVNNNNNQSYQ